MATEIIEMATISSRGQVCIPQSIREAMGLAEGSKVFFMMKDKELIIKKGSFSNWDEVTKPFKDAKKKIREEDVPDLIHRMRGVKP